MLEREWKSECQQLLELETEEQASFNLVTPRSQCPHCHNTIKSLENIPIISFLLQRGKCRHCGTSISIQYPLVELFTALITAYVAYRFGFTWQTVAGFILVWSLISLAVIDFKTTLLPDNITLPILWLGIIANYFELFCTLEDSVIGAIIGYLALWFVFHTFKLITGKEGMGYGDFKLLSLLGAWLGWQYLITIILLSSIVGSIMGITLIATKLVDRNKAMPFGPYLAMAGLICLLWGPQLKASFNFL